MPPPDADALERWPALPLAAWKPTCETIHRWTQILGKIRLALAPPMNHWWQVTLRVTPTGLATGTTPYDDGAFEIALDLLHHELVVATSAGEREVMPLGPGAVADFYEELMTLLRSLGIDVAIWTTPVEIPGDTLPLDQDRKHVSYEAEWASRFFQVLLQADLALERFASRFQGKQSPAHFFWGSFDLAQTRFSGRLAPPRPGADRITLESYSHEVASFGFWPGTEGKSDAAFFAYGAPAPGGLRDVRLSPASWDTGFGEFLLPYEIVRRSSAPEQTVLDFFQGAYEAVAALGRWDRATLDREPVLVCAPGAAAHVPEQPSP